MTTFTRRTALTSLIALGASASVGTAAMAADAAPAQAELDLRPFFTVSSAKAPGYAGLVALRVENVGSKHYYANFPIVSFRIDIHTEKGPEGVDRVITPGWFNGAYTRDLGFDKETSTRSFLVTLSNPVNKGEKQLIANLNFGDGNTREGRLFNSVTVTQVGRAKGDVSEANDQKISSKQHTLTDTGKKHPGVF